MSNSLLWQITSPGGVVSYLFGTMHVRDMQAFGLLDQVKECIEHSHVYYSELEMDPGGMEVLSQFQKLSDDRDLTSLMSHHKYGRLRTSIIKSFGLDIDHIRHFYPMIVANIIQTSILNNASDVILDYDLYRYARRLGKELRFLESQKKQLALFHEIPLDYQTKSLIQLGRQPVKAKKQIVALLQDYAKGNTRQLYQRSKNQLGKMRHLLLYQRNEFMAKKLIDELQETSAFVGVGAAHLFGYKGILRLMKQGGYIIDNGKLKMDN